MCECGEFNFVTTDCEMKKKIRKQTIKNQAKYGSQKQKLSWEHPESKEK